MRYAYHFTLVFKDGTKVEQGRTGANITDFVLEYFEGGLREYQITDLIRVDRVAEELENPNRDIHLDLTKSEDKTTFKRLMTSEILLIMDGLNRQALQIQNW